MLTDDRYKYAAVDRSCPPAWASEMYKRCLRENTLYHYGGDGILSMTDRYLVFINSELKAQCLTRESAESALRLLQL